MFSDAVIRLPFRSDSGAVEGSAFVQLTIRVANKEDAAQASYATCRIDSGATLTVFDAEIARRIGLLPEDGKRITTVGVGGSVAVWLHDVVLDLPGGRVTARVGFQRDLPVMGLLGMAGFFEHFRVTFDGPAQVCELQRLTGSN